MQWSFELVRVLFLWLGGLISLLCLAQSGKNVQIVERRDISAAYRFRSQSTGTSNKAHVIQANTRTHLHPPVRTSNVVIASSSKGDKQTITQNRFIKRTPVKAAKPQSQPNYDFPKPGPDQHFANLSLLSIPIPGSLCPASGASKLENSVACQYPSDVYDSVNVTEEMLASGKYKPCGVWDKGSNSFSELTTHYCEVSSDFCPIHQQNLLDATHVHIKMNGSTEATTHHLSTDDASFCQFHKALTSKDSRQQQRVNIIVFGGSILGGMGSKGCLSNSSVESGIHCVWFSRFYEYLQAAYRTANISTYNFGQSGHGSVLIADRMKEWLKHRELHTFSQNDLIFLDSATNDHQVCKDCAMSTEEGLQSILKTLYLKSPNTRPNIVLLESEVLSGRNITDTHYSIAYRKIASTYGVPLWSYRNVALSDYTAINQSKYYERLQYLDNCHITSAKRNAINIHPPWDLHLFQADLYAAILESKFAHCKASNNNQSSTSMSTTATVSTSAVTLKQQKNISNLLFRNNSAPNDNNKTLLSCPEGAPRYLHITDDALKLNMGPIIGTFHSEPKNAWTVRQDVPGKPTGLITETTMVDILSRPLCSRISCLLTTATQF